MIPTKDSGVISYTEDFDGKNLKYDSETRKGNTATDGEAMNNKDIVIYTLATDAFDTKFGSESTNSCLKVGEIFLQIDENKTHDNNDTYTVNIKATEATASALNTEKFSWGVAFESCYDSIADDPLNGTELGALSLTGLPTTVSGLTPYTAQSGATSSSFTTHTTGFNIVKVSFYLTGLDESITEQKFLLSEIYPESGTPAAPLQPMSAVTFQFKAVATEVANA